MGHPSKTFWLSCLVVLSLCTTPCAAAAGKNQVATMTLEALDRIMADPACRCMVVAIAAWCSPCREELPVLDKLYRKYKEKGFSLIGVSVDAGGPKAIQPIVTKTGVTFPVYWLGEDAVKRYRIFGIPMIFLIKNGKIVDKIPGRRPEKFLEEKVVHLLAE